MCVGVSMGGVGCRWGQFASNHHLATPGVPQLTPYQNIVPSAAQFVCKLWDVHYSVQLWLVRVANVLWTGRMAHLGEQE